MWVILLFAFLFVWSLILFVAWSLAKAVGFAAATVAVGIYRLGELVVRRGRS